MAIGEHEVARVAIDRLKVQSAAEPGTIDASIVDRLEQADLNLEGTYIVRVYAVFDATLRSYDRHRFRDPGCDTKVAVMIDQLGSLLGVPTPIREGLHRARRVRHFWAHELEEDPGRMSLKQISGYIHVYLDRFPKSW